MFRINPKQRYTVFRILFFIIFFYFFLFFSYTYTVVPLPNPLYPHYIPHVPTLTISFYTYMISIY